MEYQQYIKYTRTMSEISCDPRTKIGCILLNKNIIENFSWNYFPMNIKVSPKRLKDKDKYMVHAEQRLIGQCSRAGISTYNKTIVLSSLPPCTNCAKLIITSGINTVVYSCKEVPERWSEDCEFGLKLLREANIDIINVS